MQSVNATILEIKNHVLRIRILGEAPALVEKDIKINGLKTTPIHNPLSKEADDCQADLRNVLAYHLPGEPNIDSLAVGNVCEVTWD